MGKSNLEYIKEKIKDSSDRYEKSISKQIASIKRGEYSKTQLETPVLSKVGELKEIQALDGLENTLLSSNGSFGVGIAESIQLRSNQKKIHYTIRITHLNSGNRSDIFTSDKSLVLDLGITSMFNLYAWHPNANVLVMTGNEGRENNVYLAYVYYDAKTNEVKYCIVKIIEFSEQSALMNYKWFDNGKGFTFTRYCNSKYEVYRFDMESLNCTQFQHSSEIVSLIYDNYKMNQGFAVLRNGEDYFPVFIDKMSNTAIVKVNPIGTTVFKTPYIYGAFSLHKEQIGFYAIDNYDRSMTGCYNYEENKLQSVQTRWEAPKDSYYPLQCLSPIWLYDRFLIFAYDNQVSYVVVDDPGQSDKTLVVEELSRNEGQSLNSLQGLHPIMDFAYCYRFNKKFCTVMMKSKTSIKTNPDVLIVETYKVQCSNLTSKDEESGMITLKRESTPSRMSQYNATLSEMDGKRILEFKSEDDYKKALKNKQIYVRWSVKIKERNVTAEYRRSTGPIIVPDPVH